MIENNPQIVDGRTSQASCPPSQNKTLLRLWLRGWLKRRHNRLVKDILQLVLRERRTLHILDRTQFLGHTLAIFLADRRHLRLSQLLTNLRVVAEIGLRADDEAWNARAVVVNLRKPFLADVLEGGGGGDTEAD